MSNQCEFSGGWQMLEVMGRWQQKHEETQQKLNSVNKTHQLHSFYGSSPKINTGLLFSPGACTRCSNFLCLYFHIFQRQTVVREVRRSRIARCKHPATLESLFSAAGRRHWYSSLWQTEQQARKKETGCCMSGRNEAFPLILPCRITWAMVQ